MSAVEADLLAGQLLGLLAFSIGPVLACRLALDWYRQSR
jgi:hypothetical protein